MGRASVLPNYRSFYERDIKQGDKMNYFDLKDRDILEKLLPYFDRGTLRYNDQNRIYAATQAVYDGPWLHTRVSEGKKCNVDHTFYFPVFGLLTDRCVNCWKVVVRPRTLSELMKLWELQRELYLPAKCGIELRPTVFGNYGGYFYNGSLEDGRLCYKSIRALVNERISPDVKVILKRGCTEYEMALGDSSTWAVTPASMDLQRRLDDLFVTEIPRLGQTPEIVMHTLTKWIEHAYCIGDETYKEFTEGKSLFPSYTTYHEE